MKTGRMAGAMVLSFLLLLTGCAASEKIPMEIEKPMTELTYVTNLEDAEQLITLQTPLLEQKRIRLVPVDLPAGEPTEALQKLINAGETPDLILMDGLEWTSIVKWAENKAIRSIRNSKITNCAALRDRTQDWSRLLCRGSEWYALPVESWNPEVGDSSLMLYCRMDWAKNLGVEDLNHLDWSEFMSLLEGYTYLDPDHNKASDTWGLTYAGPQLNGLKEIFYEGYSVSEWVWEDDRLVPGWSSGKAKEVTQWLTQMTRSGILDPHGSEHSPEEALELFCRGYAGMIIWDDPASLEETWRDIQATREKSKLINESVTAIALPQNPYGTIRMGGDRQNSALALFGPQVSEDHVERLLSVLDEVSRLAWALPEQPAEDASFMTRCSYRKRVYYRPYQYSIPDLTVAMGSTPVELVNQKERETAEAVLSEIITKTGRFDALWTVWETENEKICGDYTPRINEWATENGLNPS